MNKKKILIVGGSGYIGQALVRDLYSEYQIYSTSRTNFDDKKTLELDYAKISTIEKVFSKYQFDLIIILAAEVKINNNQPVVLTDQIFKTNLFSFNDFLEIASRLQDQAKFIFFSSMTVYDKQVSSPVKETAHLAPFHTYGLSKLWAEQLFSYYLNYYHRAGVILRLPGVFGGDKNAGFIYQAIIKLRQNQPLSIQTENLGYWESIYLLDLSKILKEFLDKYDFNKKINIFNLSYGSNMDIYKTALLIKKLLSSSSLIGIDNQDYNYFYLSNKKISKFVDFKKINFKSSLLDYIGKLT